MDLTRLSNYENEQIKLSIQGKVFILRFEGHIFHLLDSPAKAKFLLEGINELKKQQDIAAILIINGPDVFAESSYKQFIDTTREVKGDQYDVKSSSTIFLRYINFLNQFIINVANLNQITFVGLQGEVVTPFVGASLVADFRFAAENTRFVFCHKKYKMHPNGALSYFLPLFIPRSKYIEIMYSRCDVELEEIKALGLVNNIYPEKDFQDSCIREINRLLDLNRERISATKMFTKIPRNDLKVHLDQETSLLY